MKEESAERCGQKTNHSAVFGLRVDQTHILTWDLRSSLSSSPADNDVTLSAGDGDRDFSGEGALVGVLFLVAEAAFVSVLALVLVLLVSSLARADFLALVGGGEAEAGVSLSSSDSTILVLLRPALEVEGFTSSSSAAEASSAAAGLDDDDDVLASGGEPFVDFGLEPLKAARRSDC